MHTTDTSKHRHEPACTRTRARTHTESYIGATYNKHRSQTVNVDVPSHVALLLSHTKNTRYAQITNSQMFMGCPSALTHKEHTIRTDHSQMFTTFLVALLPKTEDAITATKIRKYAHNLL